MGKRQRAGVGRNGGGRTEGDETAISIGAADIHQGAILSGPETRAVKDNGDGSTDPLQLQGRAGGHGDAGGAAQRTGIL